MLRPTHWLPREHRGRAAPQEGPSWRFRRQSAALAVAATLESAGNVADIGHLRELLRTALVGWQLTLGTDGRPTRPRERRSPWACATATRAVRLLAVSPGFQTRELVGDVARHVRWLADHPPLTPWIEAAVIAAIADAALIVRDHHLIDTARNRWCRLMSRQSPEGWFPERSGADVGFLSLALDALAWLWVHHGWDDLEEPVRRAARFLTHFVHPDDNVGGVYGSCGTAFLSPHGVELAADRCRDAALLAATCRRRCRRFERDRLPAWDESVHTFVGVPHALASLEPCTPIRAVGPYPCAAPGRWRFPHAGLTVTTTPAYHAVVNDRRGGAVHVTWPDAASLEDPGVVVVGGRMVRHSAAYDAHAERTIDGNTITVRGRLRRATRCRRLPSMASAAARFGKLWRKGLARGSAGDAFSGADAAVRGDWYERAIVLDDAWIRIRDRIHCRLPCQAVLCGAPTASHPAPIVDRVPFVVGDRGAVVGGGGRYVSIVRTYDMGRATTDAETMPG